MTNDALVLFCNCSQGNVQESRVWKDEDAAPPVPTRSQFTVITFLLLDLMYFLTASNTRGGYNQATPPAAAMYDARNHAIQS